MEGLSSSIYNGLYNMITCHLVKKKPKTKVKQLVPYLEYVFPMIFSHQCGDDCRRHSGLSGGLHLPPPCLSGFPAEKAA